MRVNLIREEKKKFQFHYFQVAMVLGILIPIFVVGILQYSLISERNTLEQEIASIEDQLEIYLPLEAEYREYESVVDELRATPTVPDYNWDRPIEALGYLVPIRGVINSFSLSQGNLSVRGVTSVGEELREFINALEDSPYFYNVVLDTMEKQEEVFFVVNAQIARGEEE